MYISYQIYQAGRVKGVREQREADVRAGELAQAFARLLSSLLPARHRPVMHGTGEHEAIPQSCVTSA